MWGGVLLDAPSKFGMVLLCYEDIPTQDNRFNRMSVFVEKGSTIIIKGSAKIGGGAQLLVRGKSKLVLGNDFYLSLNSSIYCYRHIEIGGSCTVGWNVLIMDTDWHQTYNSETMEVYDMNSPVKIGNHCWICNDVQIQKGTELPNNVIVAAKSLCNKKYDVPEFSLIAGTPAKLKKEYIGYVR